MGAIALLVLTYVALVCARLLAGWKENLTLFIALGGTLLAIFAIDAALLPYLTNTSSPVVILLNLVGFGLMSLGAFIIWYRRWPKLNKDKAERIALDYLKKSYPQEANHRIEEEKTELKGRSWHLTAQLTRKSGPFGRQVWSLEVVIDAKTGEVVNRSEWPLVQKPGK